MSNKIKISFCYLFNILCLGDTEPTVSRNKRYNSRNSARQDLSEAILDAEKVKQQKNQACIQRATDRRRQKQILKNAENQQRKQQEEQQQRDEDPITDSNELDEEQTTQTDETRVWDHVGKIYDISSKEVRYFEIYLIHCGEDTEKMKKLFGQVIEYYKQLDIPMLNSNVDRQADSVKLQVRKAIDNLHIFINAYNSGITTKIPNCSKTQSDQANEKHREFIKQVCQFEQDMFNVQFSCCKICHQRRLNFPINKDGMCNRCKKETEGRNRFSNRNKTLPTWTDKQGTVHYELPEILKELMVAEKLLIQKVSPIVPVIHIKNGTIGSRGHCVSFFQDITNMCQVFPRLPSQVTIVKVICKSKCKDRNIVNKAFTINRNRVMTALEFLKKHNILYEDIQINPENLLWMEDKEECTMQSIIEIESSETEEEDPDR